MIKVGVVGGTGYTGAELLRILSRHERIDLVAVTSRAEAGKSIAEVFPNLRGVVDLCFSSPSDDVLGDCDFVFFATPNGTAMTLVPTLIEAGVRVVDLAADFRLKDPSQWKVWYGSSHACPELLSEAVYGLPEVNRETIRDARLVANPGCYATAVQLGFLPLVEENLVFADELIADAKSGVSGAGRKAVLSTLLCEASETFKAYSVPGHRHLPEIEQGLKAASGQTVGLTFVPHLTPMVRGIHATLYARLREVDIDLQAVFEERYQREPFVDVMPIGSHPETRSVRGANLCRLSWHRPQSRHTVVVLSVIDNLVKGAAGQAVQNMNLMLGFEECTGLGGTPMLP